MASVIGRKYLNRENWSRVVEFKSAYTELNGTGLEGMAGLLYLKRLTKPLVTKCFANNFKIADDGYFWMQIAPEGKNWWLTVMVDDRKNILQYYFDITRSNFVMGRDSYFEDLMLDVVVLPNGENILLDQDELDVALKLGNITGEEYKLAGDTAREIQDNLSARFQDLQTFTLQTLETLLEKLS